MNSSNYISFVQNWITHAQAIKHVLAQGLPISREWTTMSEEDIEEGVKRVENVTRDDPTYLQVRERYMKGMVRDQVTYVNATLKDTHIFEIDKIEKRLLLLTQPPGNKKLVKDLRLPFPAIFLDVTITPDELPEEIECEDVMEGISVTNSTDTYDDKEYLLIATQIRKATQDVYIQWYKIPLGDQSYFYGANKNANQLARFLAGFITNFLMLLNHPDVELITQHRTNSSKRLKAGKIPLPDSSRIILHGSIKRYVTTNQTELEREGFNYTFWVRGHWRHHKSTYYKQAKSIIWIQPFLKGHGELKEKSYLLESTKKDEKTYASQYLFLDDIQAATKPLGEIRLEKQQRRDQNRKERNEATT
jgi:hypothetical protein